MAITLSSVILRGVPPISGDLYAITSHVRSLGRQDIAEAAPMIPRPFLNFIHRAPDPLRVDSTSRILRIPRTALQYSEGGGLVLDATIPGFVLSHSNRATRLR